MRNRRELISIIQSELSSMEINRTGKMYKIDELVAVFSSDCTFVIAYTEVVEPRYTSCRFKLRGIYGDSLIDETVNLINPDFMQQALAWYGDGAWSNVTAKIYRTIGVSELVPPNFNDCGWIYDGDLIKLHHVAMHVLSTNPEIFNDLGILNLKKNTLFTSIYETIGDMAPISGWPQYARGILGIPKDKKNNSRYSNERDVRDMLGLFKDNGEFKFVMPEYGQDGGYPKARYFWFLREALRQNIIARNEQEYSEKPKRLSKWSAEGVYDYFGMTIAASKIIPPQVIRCGRYISVDNLKQIENSINCLLEERPELLEVYFPKPVEKKSNLFDVLRRQSPQRKQEEDPCSKELSFYYEKLEEARKAQDPTSIDHWTKRIEEAEERKKHTLTPKKP